MEIEKLNVALAPRRPWAALDMGFALGRAWYLRLWMAWVVVAVPMLLLTLALMPWGLWLAMLVLWWLKPAYEQLPLYALSRAIFNDPPTFRETLRQARRWVPCGLLANLTWRRFAPSRSFTAPVMQLEGLQRRERSARLVILHGAGDVGGWLTIAGAHFETLLFCTALLVGYALLPEELSFRDDLLGHKRFVEAAQLLFYFAAMSAIAPFYVAGGFSLYLHRRAQIEGWDIELVFRRLRARIPEKQGQTSSIVAGLVVAVLAFGALGMPTPVRADEATMDRESTGRIIAEVLQHPDFGTKRTTTFWRWKAEEVEKKETPMPAWPQLVARIGEFLMWAAVAGLIVYALYRLPGWLSRLPRRRRTHPDAKLPATTLFGLNVRKESLPEDIPVVARELAGRGELRAALALLYRGALASLMAREGMLFRDGHTEGECFARVQASCAQPLSEYFGSLTRDWQRTAYGHALPTQDDLQAHCAAWSEHFGNSR